MSIEWSAEARQLHLRNGTISYVVRVLENGALGQLHFGARLADSRSYAHLGRGDFQGFSNRVGEPIPLEYPTQGGGDYRIPALVVRGPDGSTVLDLVYAAHRIYPGKGPLAGLPATYVESDDEAESVDVTLRDAPSGLEVVLSYTIFRDVPVVTRSAVIRNGGSGVLAVTCVMSASLDLPDARWQLVQHSGAWARERHVVAQPLASGRRQVSSLRGATGHFDDPHLFLARPETTEASGEAYGIGLVYSGNFLAEAEVEPFGTTRLRIGLNPEGFAWTLEPGGELASPEAVLVHTTDGYTGLSDAFHSLYRERLVRGIWRDRPRPVLINNWEATYFDFDQEKLLGIAREAKQLGIELFVLDDGWFGARDDDTSSLGDWFVDTRKLPAGLGELGAAIQAIGMDFGLWIEPEMISRRSRLFEAHPDWAIGIPGRARSESRSQYVIDMSRPEVVDHLFGVLADVLGSAPIAYVKWDMNRNITEPFSPALPPERQGEFFHRYILGLYDLYRRLTEAFPQILFESCAGGGGRYDPGLLAFAPQTWASDDTDAVERLRIQWGTSQTYPLCSMGAHVSAVPNHQVGRVTPLSTRAAVAFFGVLGYELDPTRFDEEERRQVREQVAYYKQRRELFQRGRFLRLRSPFEGYGNETAWMTVDPEGRRSVVGWYRVLSRPSPGPSHLRLRGLDPSTGYRVTVWPDADDALVRANTLVRGGDDLMEVGLFLDDSSRESATRGDFQARLFDLVAE